MSGWVAVVAAALLLAVVLQSATGFGFALLAGPSLYAVMDPDRAVALLLILGLLRQRSCCSDGAASARRSTGAG